MCYGIMNVVPIQGEIVLIKQLESAEVSLIKGSSEKGEMTMSRSSPRDV